MFVLRVPMQTRTFVKNYARTINRIRPKRFRLRDEVLRKIKSRQVAKTDSAVEALSASIKSQIKTDDKTD